jgi:hypothetical protein
MLEMIFVILIGAGLLYATFARSPMSFDDLLDLHWLFPSRKRPKYNLEEIRAKCNPRGICLRRGRVNSPWTSQVCKCTGFKYLKMYYGQPLCECGDLYLQHAQIGFQQTSTIPEI